MPKFTMAIPEAMKKALEEEKKHRKLGTIQGTIRSILAEYFAKKNVSSRSTNKLSN